MRVKTFPKIIIYPETKRCSVCREFKVASEFYKDNRRRDGLYRLCKKCHLLLFRNKNTGKCSQSVINSLKKYRDNPENKEKIRSRKKFERAFKNGKIEKKSCIVCGDNKSEAHHKDYTKPFDVVWLCRQHHVDIAKGLINL